MPKLKAISDEKELAAIPVDEPVLVALEPPVTGEERDEPQRQERQERKPKPAADEPDAGVAALQKQMEDMRRASDAETTRLSKEAAEARRERDEAIAAANSADGDLISGGLSAAQAEEKSARLALKSAHDTGDADGIADATARIGRAAADIRELERSAAVHAAHAEREKTRKPEPVTQRPRDVNAVIDAMDLLPTEREWLKKHPDAVVDQRQRTRLDAAYFDATERNLARGTPEYFAFVDQRLGYTKPAADDDNEDEGTTIVSAPVSRDNRSAQTGRVNNNQVTLSPLERETARSMGVSDIAYARGKQQLQAAKAADPEKYGLGR